MEELTCADWGGLAAGRVAANQGVGSCVLLDAHAQRTVVGGSDWNDCAIDNVKRCLSFEESHLEVKWNVSSLPRVVISSSPLDIEDSVRRSAARRGKNAEVGAGIVSAVTRAEIGSIGEDRQGGPCLRHAAGAKVIVYCAEGKVTVGTHSYGVKASAVESVGEWERDTV